MEKKLSILSLSCPSLTHISPPQLLEILTRWGNKYDQYLNPIWLNNNGKAVVGIFPKTAFYLLAPLNISSQKSNNQLRMLTLKRKSLKKILKFTEDNRVSINLTNNQSVSSFINKLTDYSDGKSKSLLHSSTEFSHGFMGFVGYDVAGQNISNTLSNQSFAEQKVVSYFGHYPIYLTCQERYGLFHWKMNLTDKKLHKRVNSIYKWITDLVKRSSPLISMPQQFQLIPRWSQKEYKHAFESVQEYLKSGDCYQINLTQEWIASLPRNEKLVNYVSKLFTHTRAPFSGYLNLQNFELLSCSPELFFTFDRTTNSDPEEITIYTKPIKGTRPRGKTIEEDQKLINELSKSEKDLAENVMIVDLLRNDIGKYAKTGTVKVPKRFEIETFTNVHHMVSTITAVIRDDISPLEVLFGSLPAGSITGTPKRRSVEIINELEGSPRGAYCGTMGFMNFDGTGQWNVLIRTIQANDNQVSLWAGGGITISSDCDAEYKECFDKVGNIIEILANK